MRWGLSAGPGHVEQQFGRAVAAVFVVGGDRHLEVLRVAVRVRGARVEPRRQHAMMDQGHCGQGQGHGHGGQIGHWGRKGAAPALQHAQVKRNDLRDLRHQQASAQGRGGGMLQVWGWGGGQRGSTGARVVTRA